MRIPATDATTAGTPSDVDVAAGSRRDIAGLARGGGINMVAAVIGAVLNTLLLIQITRGYGKATAGTFFVATALFLIITSAAALGADTGVLRFIARARALGRPADVLIVLRAGLLPAVGLSALLTVGLYLAAPQISGLMGASSRGQMSTAIKVLAPFIPVAVAYNIVLAATRGFGSMRPTALIERVARVAVQCVGVAAVQLVSGSILLLALAWVAPYLAALVVSVPWLVLLHRRRLAGGSVPAQPNAPGPEPAADAVTTREFWDFSGFRGLSRVFAVGLQRVDVILVGALRGPRDAAVYAAASRFLIVGLMAVQAIQQVTAPKISHLLANHHQHRATVVYQTSTTWLMASTWPLYLGFAVFAPTLLLVFGPAYVSGASSVTVLCTAMLVSTACGSVDSILLMAGRSSWSVVNTGLALATNIGADLVLIPRFGILGAAYGWALAILVNNLLPLAMIARGLHMHPFSVGGREVALLSLLTFGLLPLVVRIGLGLAVPVVAVTLALATVLYVAGLWWRQRTIGLDGLFGMLRRRIPHLG